MGAARLLMPLFALVAVTVAAQQPAGAASAPARDFVVIVNSANPAASIERDDLSKMFFKRLVKWPHGTAVEPIDLSPSERARLVFTQSVHGKSVGAVRAFWQQQIFSGRSVPPSEKRNDAEVMQYVREHPGAVGYVSSELELQPGVKTLEIKGLKR